MSLTRSVVSSCVTAVAISVTGLGDSISAEAALDAALEAEEASGDFVAKFNFTDLTTITQSGGGNPSIGDGISGATISNPFGNNITASGTGPTVLDTFDQTDPALTDNGGRGEELVALEDAVDSLGSTGVEQPDGSYIYTSSTGSFNRFEFRPTLEDGCVYEVKITGRELSGATQAYSWVGLDNVDGSTVSLVFTAEDSTQTAIVRADPGAVHTIRIYTSPNGAGASTDSFQISSISVRKVLTAFDGQTDLVTNGTFDTDSDWTKGTGWTIGSGVATSANGASLAYLGILTLNRWYMVRYYISAYTSGTLYAGTPTTNSPASSAGWHTSYFRADNTGLYFVGLNTFNGSIDNVSVQEVPASIARTLYVERASGSVLTITGAGSSDDFVTMAIRTTATSGVLFEGQSATYQLGIFEDGSSTTSLSAGIGSPTLRVDGVAVSPADRDALHTLLADGEWHIVTGLAVDNSSVTSFDLLHGTDADIAYAVFGPNVTETVDLAEAAAADAIKDTGYALAA